MLKTSKILKTTINRLGSLNTATDKYSFRFVQGHCAVDVAMIRQCQLSNLYNEMLR